MRISARRIIARAAAVATACALALVMVTPQANASPEPSQPGGPPPGYDLAAQFLFEDVVKDALVEIPRGVVKHGTTGVLTVTERHVEAARAIALRHDAHVTVRASRSDAIPYVDQTKVERSALAIFQDDIVSGNARYDAQTGRIEVIVRGEDSATTLAAAKNGLNTNRSAATLPPIDLVYDRPENGLKLQADVVGGKNYGDCTGGFVGGLGSAWGIITAGHCSIANNYDGATRNGSVATAYGPSGYDIMFVPLTGGTPRNKFVGDTGVLKTINAVGIPAVGGFLYKYGKITDMDATTVAADMGCTYYEGLTLCNLYRTTDLITQMGDSGGPWYAGDHGYGITTGQWMRTGEIGSVFTSLVSVLNIPGVAHVKTS